MRTLRRSTVQRIFILIKPLAKNRLKTSPGNSPVLPAQVRLATIDEDEAGQRIDNYLLRELKGVPKSHIYRILRSGEVRVNSGRIDATYRLGAGDVVRIPPVRVAAKSEPARLKSQDVQSLKPWILHEDEALIILAKPAGLAVHGGSGISLGVIELLRREYSHLKFLELAHRLDRETSGILLVAKRRSALLKLHEALRVGGMEKHYLALAEGEWQGGRRSVKVALRKYLNDEGERRVSVDEADGQAAHSIFMPVTRFVGATLLDAQIKTGRTHQIRVHLAHVGHPIRGDDKYGPDGAGKRKMPAGLHRMFLHAHRLIFNHPLSDERLEIHCPLPDDLQRYLASLKPLLPVEQS
jgi:23S rRNA pseudouridine955/2504/2580 synthase